MNKSLVTGSSGIALSLAKEFDAKMVSRTTGFDINNVQNWASKFIDYDIMFNCAYDKWAQIDVLESFSNLWGNDPNKTIVTFGSITIDHVRSEATKNHKYFPYRIHKQALQEAHNKLSDNVQCRLVMVNPGPVDTQMVSHLSVPKMNADRVAEIIKITLMIPEIKRIDLWQ